MSKELKVTKTVCLPASIWDELDRIADKSFTNRSMLLFLAITKKFEGKRKDGKWKLKDLSIKAEINNI
jgi:metal-responsive CopG/Arc/MetJ family transcriptional regulator